jgi:hypothetical protein
MGINYYYCQIRQAELVMVRFGILIRSNIRRVRFLLDVQNRSALKGLSLSSLGDMYDEHQFCTFVACIQPSWV